MTTLYRKYRPQTFASVEAQAHIITTLTNEIVRGSTAHAYLFYGPRGVGKTSVARLFAKALTCKNRAPNSAEPCNTCQSCTEIATGRALDIIEIDAASQTGVDNVRENIIDNAEFKPTQLAYKIFIIDEAHMLSTSSFNALLKTLEEPPAHAVFILATTELHKIPATIISRCQRFHFGKIPASEMKRRLLEIAQQEKVIVDTDVIDQVVAKSDGGLRDAESLLQQLLSLELPRITLADVTAILPTISTERIREFTAAILQKNTAAAMRCIQQMANDGTNIEEFATELIAFFRTLMLLAALGETAPDADQIPKEWRDEFSKNIPTSKFVTLIDCLLRRKNDIKSSPLPHLPLELFAVECENTNTATSTPRTPENEIPKKPAATPNAPVTPEPKIIPPPPIIETPPVAEITTPPKNNSHIATSVPLEKITAVWEQIIADIDVTNHSLTFILKTCTLEKIENGLLHISIPYSFHRDKVMEPKNRKIIQERIEHYTGTPLEINCVILAPTTTSSLPTTSPADDLSAAMAVFGGEVVPS